MSRPDTFLSSLAWQTTVGLQGGPQKLPQTQEKVTFTTQPAGLGALGLGWGRRGFHLWNSGGLLSLLK